MAADRRSPRRITAGNGFVAPRRGALCSCRVQGTCRAALCKGDPGSSAAQALTGQSTYSTALPTQKLPQYRPRRTRLGLGEGRVH